jgi:hypothetical protein
LAGVGVVVVRLLAAVIVVTLVWKGLTGLRSSLGAVESYIYLFGLLSLSAGIWLAVQRVGPRRASRVDMAGGMVLTWVILAVLTGFFASGMSYLFAWPALAGTLILLMPPPLGSGRLGVLGLIAIPTLILTVPAIEVFWQFAQPRPGNLDSQAVEVIAAVVGLATLAGGLITACYQRSSKTVITPE